MIVILLVYHAGMTNQGRVFKACLKQTERVSDDVTRKIGPLDFKKQHSLLSFTYLR